MRLLRSSLALAAVALLAACPKAPPPVPAVVDAGSPAAARPKPPVAPKHPETSTLHGETRTDDYAWMKKKGEKELEDWLAAENRFTEEQLLAPTKALRETLFQELKGRMKESDTSVPYEYNGYWYWTSTEAGKEHEAHWRRQGRDGGAELLLDVNALGEGQKFVAVSDVDPSDDNRLLAYTMDVSGLREYSLHLKDLKTGAALPETVPHVTGLEWASDSKTLFYTTEDAAKRSYRLYRHVVGTPVEKDALVYEEKDEHFDLAIARTLDRQLLVLSSQSLTTTEQFVLDARKPTGAFQSVLPRKQDVQYDLEHRGASYLLHLNDTGRTFRLVEAPVKSVANPKTWKELIPARPDVMLTGVEVFATATVVWERQGGLPTLRVLPVGKGEEVRFTPPEPDYDLGPGANVEPTAKAVRFAYTSMVTPWTTYELDLKTGALTVLKVEEVPGYDASKYVTERVQVPARDGTLVPLSLAYKKGTPKDGSAPVYLRGYGSYGATNDVGFSLAAASWMDRGVVLAESHLRGGGELGKPWHDAGRMLNKNNTFTDFVDCADWLVAQKWTSPKRLVINGASAGGLLMGAVINLRPELFRAAFVEVPFVDVINTMLDESLPLTVPEFEEWGNPKVKAEYDVMRSYSPYDNLAAKAYPSMLVRSAYNDTQVLYHEPAKYVAKLRTLKTDENPLYLWMDMEPAGHGGKSGRYEALHEEAVGMAFLLRELGLDR